MCKFVIAFGSAQRHSLFKVRTWPQGLFLGCQVIGQKIAVYIGKINFPLYRVLYRCAENVYAFKRCGKRVKPIANEDGIGYAVAGAGYLNQAVVLRVIAVSFVHPSTVRRPLHVIFIGPHILQFLDGRGKHLLQFAGRQNPVNTVSRGRYGRYIQCIAHPGKFGWLEAVGEHRAAYLLPVIGRY